MDLARHLLDIASSDEQVTHRIAADDDVAAIRRRIRKLAQEQNLRIRTSVIDDVLVVVRADAAVWNESREVMRKKLTPRE